MALGVTVTTSTSPPSRGAPTNTAMLFVAGQADTGPTEATLVRSIGDVTAAIGARATGNAGLWDYMDVYFREGGKQAYLGRYDPAGTDPEPNSLADALAMFGPNLGPGQIVAPQDPAGAATYGTLLDHAAANNRFALLDVDLVSDTAAELETLGAAVPDSNNEYGALFGPWVEVPAPAGITGVGSRQVPASAAVAGLIARADALGNRNRAAAGRDFPLRYVIDFVMAIADADRETVLNAGVNPLVEVYGVLEVYGFQTSVAQSDDNPFWQANCARERMAVVAEARALGENYVFRPIDGRGLLAQALKTELDAMLLGHYQVNALYGDTPQDAFAVEVGASVNTTDTIAQGELHAVAEIRPSLHAKSVQVELVTVPVTGQIA